MKNTTKVKFELFIETDDNSYSLTKFNDESVWLENEGGEGMQIWNNELFTMLDHYFKENY